jgi:hypothetical protein
MNVLIIILQAVAAFFIGTILYDIVHYVLHVFLRSDYEVLRKIGRWHSAHHCFFPATLIIQREWTKKNLIRHVLLEYLIQMTGSLLCLFFFSSLAVYLAIIFESCIFIAVCYWRGVDPHHQPQKYLPFYRRGLFVDAAYHALHHAYPNNFYSGYIKLIDYVLGTGMQLKGKQIALTGASGALGSNMKILLENEGARVIPLKFNVDYTYQDYSKLKPVLEKTDILFLCHGSKYKDAQQANCDSFIQIIELFKHVRQRDLVPLEIWGVGSEIECHPCFGFKKLQVYARSKRNYAKQAKKYFHDRDIQYRHIVHSAFWSNMGPGLMSANFAAKATLFFLKRGFKYISVTYTGIALLNYIRFIF